MKTQKEINDFKKLANQHQSLLDGTVWLKTKSECKVDDRGIIVVNNYKQKKVF